MRIHLAAALVVAAGCSTALPNQSDGGSSTLADLAVTDFASSKGDQDEGPSNSPDLALTVSPRRLYSGDFTLDGITDDDFIVFHDDNSVHATSIATGSTERIGAFDGAQYPRIVHRVVFGYDGSGQQWQQLIWSSGIGSRVLRSYSGPRALPAGGTASADGEFIGFGDAGNIMVDRVDGSHPIVLAAYDSGGNDCGPEFDFAGGRLVVGYCTWETGRTIHSFDPATGSDAELLTPVETTWWAPNPAGTRILVMPFETTPGTGDLAVVPIVGGTPISLGTGFSFGQFSPDGTAIVYQTTSHGLNRVDAGGGSGPTILQASGLTRWFALSPDGKWVLYAKTVTTQSNQATDVFLASAETSGTPKTIVIGPIASPPSFTDDASYVVFATQLSTLETQISAAPVAPGRQLQLSQSTPDGAAWRTAGGARVVYCDDTRQMSKLGQYGCDLYFADLATRDAPRAIGWDVAPPFFVTTDKKQVVYTVPGDGIFALTLP